MAIRTDHTTANAGFIEAQAEPIRLDYVEIAHNGLVSIVARGGMPLTKGGSYVNIYYWHFTFRGSRICNVKGFFDALFVLDTSRDAAASRERVGRHLPALMQAHLRRA